MEWTCTRHIRHINSCPGHAKLQKVHKWAQYTQFQKRARLMEKDSSKKEITLAIQKIKLI
jgi:hypothetical protein